MADQPIASLRLASVQALIGAAIALVTMTILGFTVAFFGGATVWYFLLVGICISWNVTNMVVGMRPQIIQSCVILAVACMWCRLTLVLLGQPDAGLIYDRIEEETEAPVDENEDDKTAPLLAHVA